MVCCPGGCVPEADEHLPLIGFPVRTEQRVQRGIHIFPFVQNAAPQDPFLCVAAFLHDPAAGGVAYIMLGFQPVQRQGTEKNIGDSFQGLSGITVIPVLP